MWNRVNYSKTGVCGRFDAYCSFAVIMLSVEEGSAATAKIIDLGLAKPAPDAPPEAAISTPGAFAGTDRT